MRLLIDTHILIWWMSEPSKIPSTAINLLKDVSNTIYVSSISVWEIELKAAAGKFPNIHSLRAAIDNEFVSGAFLELPLNRWQLSKLDGLPMHHKDPFDRVLIAQALYEGLAIISDDGEFIHYPISLIRP